MSVIRPEKFENIVDRSPPHSYEAEAGLLGAILSNNHAFEKVSEYLQPEHFADPVNGRIYAAISLLINKGQIADAVQLGHYFVNDDALKEVGGGAYLAELQGSVVSVINAGHYGKTIHDLAVRRALIDVHTEGLNEAYDVRIDNDHERQIEATETALYELVEHGELRSGMQSLKDVLTKTMQVAEAAHKHGGGLVGLETGFMDLDKLMGGLRRSNLIILAARPSMGKTALATNLASNVAKKGYAVAFFSLEMSGVELTTRILSDQAKVPSHKIQEGTLTDAEIRSVASASRDLEGLDYFIDDNAWTTVAKIRSRAIKAKRKYGKLDLIIVDYLQLIQGSSKNPEHRVQVVSEISRSLKGIAKELDVPVIALSQLSRQVENREDKRPQLSDLRESGSIEQDADTVLFIYREEYYRQREEPEPKAGEDTMKFNDRLASWRERMNECRGIANVIVGKARHGAIGTVTMSFDGPMTKFDNFSPR